jgi:hypothetical protein
MPQGWTALATLSRQFDSTAADLANFADLTDLADFASFADFANNAVRTIKDHASRDGSRS